MVGLLEMSLHPYKSPEELGFPTDRLSCYHLALLWIYCAENPESDYESMNKGSQRRRRLCNGHIHISYESRA
jgi:hypothetical protein